MVRDIEKSKKGREQYRCIDKRKERLIRVGTCTNETKKDQRKRGYLASLVLLP